MNDDGQPADQIRARCRTYLVMWTVYGPIDPYPLNCHARELLVTAEGPRFTGQEAVGPLDALRWYLSEELGLSCLGREPQDDPTVIETWV
jgi:hypothetical protein